MDRIAAGEDMVLTKIPPHILAASSGTSGKSSLIPMVKKQGLVFLIGGRSSIYLPLCSNVKVYVEDVLMQHICASAGICF